MSRRIRFVSLLLSALAAAPLAARDCTFAGNPVLNCGFPVDLDDWIFTSDLAVHEAADGDAAPGCAAIDRHDGAGALEAFTACMPADGAAAYGFGGSARVASGTMGGACLLALIEYSVPGCSGVVAENFTAVTVSGDWRASLATQLTDAATQAVQIKLVCSSGTDFVLRIDDFWLAPMLFRDGFESGDTSAWSLVNP